MKPISANMKIFYQRKMLYFWYLLMLSQLLAYFAIHDSSFNFMPFMLSMLGGIFVGGMQKEIVACPFTFCLPGQRKVPIKVVAIIGAVVNLLASFMIIFPMRSSLDTRFIPLVFAAILLLTVSIYLLSAVFMFYQDITGGFSLKGLVFTATIFSIMLFGKHLSSIMTTYPLAIIAVSLLVSYFMISMLASESKIRSLCGTFVVSGLGGWADRDKMAQFMVAKNADKRRKNDKVSFAERIFDSLQQLKINNAAKTTIGYVYTLIDSISVRGWQMLIGPFILLVIYGFIYGYHSLSSTGFNVFMIYYLIPIVGAMMWQLPMHPSIHVPASRNDKFVASFISGITFTVLTTAFLVLVAAFSRLISPYVPEPTFLNISEKMGDFHFATPNLSDCWLTLAFMPFALAMTTLFGKKPIVFIVIFQSIIMSVIFIKIFAKGFFEQVTIPHLHLLLIALMWSIFALVMYRKCDRRNLIGQGNE